MLNERKDKNMKKVALHNLGCKVNAYETEAMQEMLEKSPLKNKDEDAFNKIVEDCNWKFKEFKNYKNVNVNQYRWWELYDMIGRSKHFDLFSFFSQYAHGLSMSNLNATPSQRVFDGIIGEGVALLDIMNQYLLKIFESENYYIYEGLLIPQMRDKILECFDDEHRPTVDEWKLHLHSVLSKIKR